MKHISRTALVVMLGLMIGFSAASNACDKGQKTTAAKTAKSSSACTAADKSSMTTTHTAHEAKVMHASDTKDAGECTVQKTAANAKDCPVTSGACDEAAMKTAEMKDCCAKDAKTTKTTMKSSTAPKAKKASTIIKTASNDSK